jgi:hypothetical protein
MKGGEMNKYRWDSKTNTISRCDDITEWSAFMEGTNNRRVAMDVVGDITIYTSFLGIDYNWGNMRGEVVEPPILFETMCENSSDHSWYDLQMRYNNADDALRVHRDLVRHLQEGGNPDDYLYNRG